MFKYTVNIARAIPGTKQFNSTLPQYEHWGRVALNDSDNEAEARTKFARLVAAMPAPNWSLTLCAHPLPSHTELDRT